MTFRQPALRRNLGAVVAALVLVALPSAAAAQSAPAQPTLEPPPPTPVPVPGGGSSPSPFPSVLHTPAASTTVPAIGAPTAVLADLDTGQVLYTKDPTMQRPIASLTKIMTALLTLERSDPTDVVTVSPEAADPGPIVGISQLGLVPGERISVEDLLYALLLQSANDAALALAEHVSGSVEAFVHAMNARARHLGLRHTRFASPNGLDDAGYSTTADLAELTRKAMAEQPLLRRIVATRVYREPPPPPGGEPRIVQNRNVLLWLYPGATGVKTGFTRAAGSCVVAAAERDGLRLVAVILGGASEPFSAAGALLDYGFAAFERRPLVHAGQELGTVTIDGRPIGVIAGSGLEGLVPVDAEPRLTVSVDPAAAYPPGIGERVGRLAVAVPGIRVGRIPVVVASVPGPPQPEGSGPWWRRAGQAVQSAIDGFLDALFG